MITLTDYSDNYIKNKKGKDVAVCRPQTDSTLTLLYLTRKSDFIHQPPSIKIDRIKSDIYLNVSGFNFEISPEKKMWRHSCFISDQ